MNQGHQGNDQGRHTFFFFLFCCPHFAPHFFTTTSEMIVVIVLFCCTSIQLRGPMYRGGSLVSSIGIETLFEPQIKLGFESTNGDPKSPSYPS